ncbi:MAG: hypothetical protein RBT63_00275 [Bdellovibrionales bacterium]|jgi:hypothetical protein|nr:hypothetical protein [Bdellovibrionales bacterium]
MAGRKIILTLCAIGLSVVSFGQACGPAFSPFETELASTSDPGSTSLNYLSESEREACVDAGIEPFSGPVNSIPALVAYINTLPRPVQIHCFVANLPRPLYVQAGSSARSAQPSPGPSDPRIFIKSGNLVMGVVPAGLAVNTLEISELTGGGLGEKAEFRFPIVEAAISEATGLDHIRFGSGTSCGLCHQGESYSRALGGSMAFKSNVLQFAANERITIPELRSHARRCRSTNDQSERCLLFRALFDGDSLRPTEY